MQRSIRAEGFLHRGEHGDVALTVEFSGSSNRLWQSGRMNDHRAEATNQLSKELGTGEDEHACVYGIWSELLVGEWGAIEVLANPYTLAAQGLIKVTSFYLADVAPRPGAEQVDEVAPGRERPAHEVREAGVPRPDEAPDDPREDEAADRVADPDVEGQGLVPTEVRPYVRRGGERPG